jgi:hypothetical protein
MRDLVMTQLDENLARLKQTNHDFDAWWAAVPEYLIYEAGRNTNFPLHPAHYWTHVNKERFVDFVGKVEQFEEDFKILCQRLRIDDAAAGNANVTDAEAGEAAGDAPRYAARMNRASIAKINALFREDFAYFNYPQLPG